MTEEKRVTKRPKLEPDSRSATLIRSIDACQRCRQKKVKCDQNFPTCSRCSKAGSECVGVDRATGRAVPRSYVHHLEENNLSLKHKLSSLENLLNTHGVSQEEISQAVSSPMGVSHSRSTLSVGSPSNPARLSKSDNFPDDATASSNQTYMGASSGISFAKMVTTALKMKDQMSHLQVDPSKNPPERNKKPAVLPPKGTAQQFVRIYFAHSNSQLPILHREAFLTEIFEPVYGSWDDTISPSVMPFTKVKHNPTIVIEDTWLFMYKQNIQQHKLAENKSAPDSLLYPSSAEVPEKFHRPLYYLNIIFAIASSVNHQQYANDISEQFRKAGLAYASSTYRTHDLLEQLQAKLLLALFSLMRPCKPGIWSVTAECLTICVELGLHNNSTDKCAGIDAFTLDRRRRLFWCAYALDRQICFYMGRPVRIHEASVKTPFPSELDDAYILKNCDGVEDFSKISGEMTSSKSISLSFFCIRKIQSEVQRILYEGEELPRRYNTLSEWKDEMQEKVERWWTAALKSHQLVDTDFHLEFFSLNYNHTVLSLNGLTPNCVKLSQSACIRMAEASQNLIRCYMQLYIKKAINYTWAAVQNLTMAGISFLYALYTSDDVKEVYTKEVVMKITEECITVLSSLIASCDAARGCSQTFRLLSAAILKFRYNESVDGLTRVNNDQESPSNDADQGWNDPRNFIKQENTNDISGFEQTNPQTSAGETGNAFFTSFEWITRREAHEATEYASELSGSSRPSFLESNLEEFLTQIDNSSPGNSLPDITENSFSDYALGIDSSTIRHARDGRKALELVQSSTENIWDQFFTQQNATLKIEIDQER